MKLLTHLWQAFRSTWIPNIIIQLISVTLVVLYFQTKGFHEFLDRAGNFFSYYYPWPGVIQTSLFGGLAPMLIEAALGRRKASDWSLTKDGFIVLCWAGIALMLGWLYRLQVTLFGEGTDPLTLFFKTSFDQFLWTPIFLIPVLVIMYEFSYRGCSVREMLEGFRNKSFKAHYMETLITTWIFWIPGMTIVYCFPVSMQLLLTNLILLMWSLVLLVLSKDTEIFENPPLDSPQPSRV